MGHVDVRKDILIKPYQLRSGYFTIKLQDEFQEPGLMEWIFMLLRYRSNQSLSVLSATQRSSWKFSADYYRDNE